jgi:hypothetical protein
MGAFLLTLQLGYDAGDDVDRGKVSACYEARTLQKEAAQQMQPSRPAMQFGWITRIIGLVIAIPTSIFLSQRFGWPIWAATLCFVALYVAILLAMTFGVAAWEVRRFKKLGVPWDRWPHDAE